MLWALVIGVLAFNFSWMLFETLTGSVICLLFGCEYEDTDY